jgi:hypothetical protein
MDKVIRQEMFKNEFFTILDEVFVTHHGIFLDKNTSLFETLETITAAEASRPVGEKCATLAAQIAHVNFYLEVLENYLVTKEGSDVDWGEIWRTVKGVSPAEWVSLKEKLKLTYERVLEVLRGFESWDDEIYIGGAFAILVHTTYHLGEIRQALCTLK